MKLKQIIDLRTDVVKFKQQANTVSIYSMLNFSENEIIKLIFDHKPIAEKFIHYCNCIYKFKTTFQLITDKEPTLAIICTKNRIVIKSTTYTNESIHIIINNMTREKYTELADMLSKVH